MRSEDKAKKVMNETPDSKLYEDILYIEGVEPTKKLADNVIKKLFEIHNYYWKDQYSNGVHCSSCRAAVWKKLLLIKGYYYERN